MDGSWANEDEERGRDRKGRDNTGLDARGQKKGDETPKQSVKQSVCVCVEGVDGRKCHALSCVGMLI